MCHHRFLLSLFYCHPILKCSDSEHSISWPFSSYFLGHDSFVGCQIPSLSISIVFRRFAQEISDDPINGLYYMILYIYIDTYDIMFLSFVCRALEIWCIEKGHLLPLPKSSHGKFFSGSSYIILSTVVLKSGLTHHDIHYWLGKNASEMDSAMASDKAMELDAALGSRAVQYREDQGFETEKFLSYFKPCIIPVEGVFSSESELQGVGAKSYGISRC